MAPPTQRIACRPSTFSSDNKLQPHQLITQRPPTIAVLNRSDPLSWPGSPADQQPPSRPSAGSKAHSSNRHAPHANGLGASSGGRSRISSNSPGGGTCRLNIMLEHAHAQVRCPIQTPRPGIWPWRSLLWSFGEDDCQGVAMLASFPCAAAWGWPGVSGSCRPASSSCRGGRRADDVGRPLQTCRLAG